MDIDYIYSEIQNRLNTRVALVIGTGASMAVNYDFGMPSLERKLKINIPNLIINDKKAQVDWCNVVEKINQNIDFENALNEVKSEYLLDKIIVETGKHVASVSLNALQNVHKGSIPLIHLLSSLKNLLSKSHPLLDIITPNYDLIIENALSHCSIPYTDGFWGGYIKKYNWKEAKGDFTRIVASSTARKGASEQKSMIPFVRLHKVHGSLNYFIQNEDVVRIDSLAYFIEPSCYERFIITPGESKHKRIVLNRDFYVEMDKTIEEAGTYLFIGYGFNDIDIDNKIRSKIEQGKQAIIVTKALTSNVGVQLIDNPNNIIIVDNNRGGAKIYHNNQEIDFDKPIWEIDKFTKEIL